jgi:hypothetical protein
MKPEITLVQEEVCVVESVFEDIEFVEIAQDKSVG